MPTDPLDDARLLLGLRRYASINEIKEAYRTEAKKWHPDVSTADNEKSERMLSKIKDAYELLLNHASGYPLPLFAQGVEQEDPTAFWHRRFNPKDT